MYLIVGFLTTTEPRSLPKMWKFFVTESETRASIFRILSFYDTLHLQTLKTWADHLFTLYSCGQIF